MLRWWWRAYANQQSLWIEVITSIKMIGANQNGPSFWVVDGSFFWRELHKLLPLFRQSTQWDIADASKISFWYDTWGDAPLCLTRRPLPVRSRISLREAIPVIHQLAPQLTQQVQDIVLTQGEDCIRWKWGAVGVYSAKSIYDILMGIGRIVPRDVQLWRYKISTTVKVFVFLLLRKKILTQDVLRRRNIGCTMGCVVCGSTGIELARHLMFQCSYTVQIWRGLEEELGIRILTTGQTVQEIWLNSMQLQSNRYWKKNRSVLLSATCWLIWKNRNAIVFNDRRMLPRMLVQRIIHEFQMWVKYC